MGKSDAVVMREKLNIAMDESLDVNDRVFALDDFEMVSPTVLSSCRPGADFDLATGPVSPLLAG